MARGGRGGRPPADQGDGGTRQVRVFEDMADKVAYIVKVVGGSSAQLLDDMIRADVESLYEQHKAAIEKIKAAEAALRKAMDDAATQASAPPRTKKPRRP